MLRDRKIYVLWDEKLRAEVIQLHHNMPVREHGGQWKIVELVTRNFWWPEVTKKVKKYIESCNICQRNKNHTEALAGKLIPNAVPEKPWSHITADFITKLLLVQEYNVILVVLWDDFQEGNYFLCIHQLNGKYPRIQCGKDINSMGGDYVRYR